MHMVVYDRGPLQDLADQLAKQMADASLRLQSYRESRVWRRGIGHALCLTLLGFYHIPAHDAPDTIRCSFCRRTFATGPYFESAPAEIEFETQLVHLQQRHAIRSPTCPFVLGVRGDNEDLPAGELQRAIQEASTISVQLVNKAVTLSITPHADISVIASHQLGPILSSGDAGAPTPTFPTAPQAQVPVAGATSDTNTEITYKPPIDINEYFTLLSEFHCEPHSIFNQLDFEMDEKDGVTNLDGYVPGQSLLELLLLKAPRFPEYVTLLSRLESYQKPEWITQQAI